MIHVYASQPNYWRHLVPIVDALRADGHDVATWAERAYQPWGDRVTFIEWPAGDVVVVASWRDARRALTSRVVYVEHGSGQTYRDGPGDSYAGAERLGHVVAFLCPGEHVAARWRDVYPDAVVEAVGCPALDVHYARQAGTDTVNEGRARGTQGRGTGTPLVAVTGHWRCTRFPETLPATPLFYRGLSELARLDSIRMVGHAHPRAVKTMQAMWARLGVPFEPDPDQILQDSDLLVTDNSSLAYEAAALDIPVLSLNAPAYRRDVEHGLRFWSHVPGIQCDTVGTFIPAVMAALDDPPEAADLRRRAAAHVYRHRDAHCAQRAAAVIEKIL